MGIRAVNMADMAGRAEGSPGYGSSASSMIAGRSQASLIGAKRRADKEEVVEVGNGMRMQWRMGMRSH
jgi:hypothetical protein